MRRLLFALLPLAFLPYAYDVAASDSAAA